MCLVGLLALLPVVGCRESLAPARPAPVLIVGIDGLEWSFLLPLLREGRLPNVDALMQRGTFGRFATMTPTYSPVIWTTIATGKPPREHGIAGFAHQAIVNGKPALKLFESTDRRTKAFWNIASDYDRRVAVVGWWMTFPVEPVRGVMVAQTNTLDQADVAAGRNLWKGVLRKGIPGQVFPPERQDEFLGDLEAVDRDLPELTREIFGSFPHPLAELDRRLWDNCQWAFRADATYARIARKLLVETPGFDVLAVYFGGPDVVSHRFLRYMEPQKFDHRPTPQQIENFQNVIRDYYVYIDRLIGELVEAAGHDATVLVISDHGFHEFNTHARFDADSPPKDVNSGHHLDAPPGVLIAAGPKIAATDAQASLRVLERSDAAPLAQVADLTPTLLAMLGIPVGEDMQGRVRSELLSPLLLETHPVAKIATHDHDDWRESLAVAPAERDETERQEQLRSLGYLD